MARKAKLKVGPWRGYRSSVTAYDCEGTELPTGCYNYLVDQFDGRLRRRKGSDRLLGGAGLLEYAPTDPMTGVKLFGLSTLTFGGLAAVPTQACLFASENGTTTNGTLWYNLSGTSSNIGSGITTQYPATFKPWNLRGGGRLSTAAARMQVASGSRNCITLGNRTFFPNYTELPCWWNQQDAVNGTTSYNTCRVMPTGMVPPLFHSTITETAPAGGTTANWPASKMFAYAWAFKDVSGAWSVPTMVRTSNANLTGGFGIFSISATAPNKLTHTNVPIGPYDTVQRALLRTPLVATTGIPDLSDFRVAAYINNNTQTTYDDFAGNDDGLEVNAIVFDALTAAAHKWPPRARYYWTARGRVFAGYVRPNPAAILITPYTASGAHNVSDVDATSVTDRLYFGISGTTLTFYGWDGNAAHNDSTFSVTLTSAKTLQDVCDEINGHAAITVPNSGTQLFVRAAVVPGADPNQASVEGGVSVFNTTGGDNFTSNSGARTGTVRAYCNAWPGCLYFTDAILDKQQTAGRRAVEFTKGDPGNPRFNIMHWDARNRRELPEDMGVIVGGGEVRDGSVVCATGGIMFLTNTRDFDTGADADMDWRVINKSRGCIAPFSIVQGEGWVAYMTSEGYVATDGNEEIMLSGDVWDPGSGRGEWAYEINKSMIAVEGNTMDSKFFATVVGSRIVINYRISDSAGNTLVYDYSPGTAANGLRQLLRPNGQLYGWSTPLTYGQSTSTASSTSGAFGCLGSIKASDGYHLYMEVGLDGDNATTFDGRIYEIEAAGTTSDYGSKRFGAEWRTPIVRGENGAFREKVSFVRADMLHYHAIADETVNALLSIAKNDGSVVSDSFTVPDVGVQDAPKRSRFLARPTHRSMCENFQLRETIPLGVNGTGDAQIHAMDVEYNIGGGAL